MEEATGFMLGQVGYGCAAFLLRLLVAATLLPFGIKKFMDRKGMKGFPQVFGLSWQTSFYLAMFAEICAPVCVFFGFFTRIAALGGIANMGIAYYTYIHFPKHKEDPFYYGPALPILLGYIFIFIIGPGSWSIDHFIF